ncbi:MAG: sulfopyruvate decarboxylase subunit beta [Promethearchaeati archaeon SRVP18_Atabeyarchaeia-1]
MSSQIAESIVNTLRAANISFFAMFPCEKVRRLYDLVGKQFRHVAVSREEEGVGMCAGAYLAGAKPAMLVQSSGIGNMINALCSLTMVYKLPLLILVSWRGVYKERIPAQIPLGRSLPKLLEALGIKYTAVRRKGDIAPISKSVAETYSRSRIHALLLSPSIWEEEASASQSVADTETHPDFKRSKPDGNDTTYGALTRFEVLKTIAPYLENKVVVCNLGIPSKELYSIKHQKSNFYMLGSMGLASSIGLGISLFTSKQVVVIEGDGSLLMNLGALSTIATARPPNLTILAIDNGVHGSTGNQPTATSLCVDLEVAAKGLGIEKTSKAASREQILSAIQSLDEGPNFVHILARPGNSNVSDIPLSPLDIKKNIMESLRR